MHTGGIEPQQVIHYKKDGTKEFFYPEYSESAINGAKTFEYESDGRGGAYTIVFASYDTSGKMTTVKTLIAELNAGVNSEVEIPEDVTPEAGDKIFLWENLKTLRPLCDAYTVNK